MITRVRASRGLACAAAALFVAAAHAADVDLALVRMGVGNHVRAGDPTALLVRATSNLAAPVQARIEWAVRNADGDTALYGRDIALAPGAPVERWIYGVTPIVSASAQSSTELVTSLRVLEITDGRPTRILGEKRIDGSSGDDPAVPVEVTEALVGVVGDGRAGLSALATPTPNLAFIASMNELTKIARGITAAGLPDRWEGLASFESIIWTNAPLQGVGAEQARALLDWTRRGGNLVIVLPESGDPWGVGGKRDRTPFTEALPLRAERRDAVPVADLLPVLARSKELRNPAARTAVWTFPEDPGNGFAPLIVAPGEVDGNTGSLTAADGVGGRALAVRRPFGFGFVTVVGVDVDGLDRRSLAADGIPQADVFWNRILGRRADAPSPAEWAALAAAKRLETRGGLTVPGDGGALVNQYVGMRSLAAIGVLGLIGAFAIYWALSGPVAFLGLRAARRPQYSWLAFVAVGAAASAAAWITTGIFRFTHGRVQHLTFLDRVEWRGVGAEERAVMRANSWFSAELPGYGSARVSLAKAAGQAGNHLLASWFPPPAGNASGFPDTESYDVPLGSPASYDLPARATSTVLNAQWMGVPVGAWDATPREVGERRLRQDVTWGAAPRIALQGALVHGLPAALEDVLLIHVTPFHTPGRRNVGTGPTVIEPSGSMPSYARMVRVARWDRNVPLDVGTSLYGGSGGGGGSGGSGGSDGGSRSVAPSPARTAGEDDAARTIKALWYSPVLESATAAIDPGGALRGNARLEMLQLYAMLQPPAYLIDGRTPAAAWRGDAVRVERDFARQVDLSRWCSQPCLIVIGRIVDEGTVQGLGMPIPFTIGGDEPKADGTTFVRVVFPLPTVPAAMVAP